MHAHKMMPARKSQNTKAPQRLINQLQWQYIQQRLVHSASQMQTLLIGDDADRGDHGFWD